MNKIYKIESQIFNLFIDRSFAIKKNAVACVSSKPKHNLFKSHLRTRHTDFHTSYKNVYLFTLY